MKNSNLPILYEQRCLLIQALEKGEIDKETFIQENYKLISDIKHVDLEVSSMEEGLLKYHYFNTMAKMKMIEADEIEFRDPATYQRLKNMAYAYYQKKEQVTYAFIKYKDFKNMHAYFIDLNSKALNGSIFEIVLEDAAYAVLHSKDKKILNLLKKAACFEECIKPSVIHTYVNTKVY